MQTAFGINICGLHGYTQPYFLASHLFFKQMPIVEMKVSQAGPMLLVGVKLGGEVCFIWNNTKTVRVKF